MKHQRSPSNRFVAVAQNRGASVWHSRCSETLGIVLLCDYSWEGTSHPEKYFYVVFFSEDTKKRVEREKAQTVRQWCYLLLHCCSDRLVKCKTTWHGWPNCFCVLAALNCSALRAFCRFARAEIRLAAGSLNDLRNVAKMKLLLFFMRAQLWTFSPNILKNRLLTDSIKKTFLENDLGSREEKLLFKLRLNLWNCEH